jgi:DNA repair protein RadC
MTQSVKILKKVRRKSSKKTMVTAQTSRNHKGEGHRKRLRHKFFESGLTGFHDYEVIELLLLLNTPRKVCKQSAKSLLKKFKIFQAVFEKSPNELMEVEGVGRINSLGIRLVKEVSDRYHKSKIVSWDVVKNPTALFDYLQQTIGHKKKEVFVGIFLDAGNRVLASEILFQGTLTTSFVHPREIILKALQHNAAAVIFAHNHPSGDTDPSQSDLAITKKLFYALKFVGIVMHEHLIIGDKGFYSFSEQGMISNLNVEFENTNE